MVHAAGGAAYDGSAEEMVRRRDELCLMERMGDAQGCRVCGLVAASE
jgi:hypothetical protein